MEVMSWIPWTALQCSNSSGIPGTCTSSQYYCCSLGKGYAWSWRISYWLCSHMSRVHFGIAWFLLFWEDCCVEAPEICSYAGICHLRTKYFGNCVLAKRTCYPAKVADRKYDTSIHWRKESISPYRLTYIIISAMEYYLLSIRLTETTPEGRYPDSPRQYPGLSSFNMPQMNPLETSSQVVMSSRQRQQFAGIVL
jgi:hypothetical protein